MTNNETTPQDPQQEAAAVQSEVMPSLEEMLQAAELKAQEHYDAWMYAKAEGENIRRRAQEDISKAQKFAVERFSNELLAVMDSLQAGLAVQTGNVESFKSGMELTAEAAVRRVREIQHQGNQPGRREIRCAQTSGHRHGGKRAGTEHRGYRDAEGPSVA